MPEFCIGLYTYCTIPKYHKNYYLHTNRQLDEAAHVRSRDRRLHESLDKIFCERCSSISSSSKFKKFRRDPQHSTDWKSIIWPILKREPGLKRYFSKEELEKLSLLWISVLVGYYESAELLVRSGADINELFGCHKPQVIDKEWTVLHVLLQMDPSPLNERLIRLVVDYGADFKARDCIGQTVLHYAVNESRVQMTEMLLEKGADVEAANDMGRTPLHLAVRSIKANELVPLLVKHGADIFTKDRQGTNLLHGLTLFRSQEHAPKLAKDFIEKGISLDDKGANLMQPIHLAALNRNDELVKLYLDHGANVNALTVNGESPLYMAAKSHPWVSRVVEILLERGAKVDLRTIGPFGNRTALLAVCKSASSCISDQYEHTIRLLLSAGADVLIEDFDGKTPLARILSGRWVKPKETRLLIKALALRKARQPLIELKDERIIERHRKLRNYYWVCIKEIDRMKSTRFIETCSLFKLVTESPCQIATLMRNPSFKTQFRQCDLNGFSIYVEDIRRAFERALNLYPSMLKQVDVIIEAFYNILPHLVVDKIVNYTFDGCKN